MTTTPKPDPDKALVALSQAIKAMSDQWAHQLQLIGMQARVSRARYEALRREGFTEQKALSLCTTHIEL